MEGGGCVRLVGELEHLAKYEEKTTGSDVFPGSAGQRDRSLRYLWQCPLGHEDQKYAGSSCYDVHGGWVLRDSHQEGGSKSPVSGGQRERKIEGNRQREKDGGLETEKKRERERQK